MDEIPDALLTLKEVHKFFGGSKPIGSTTVYRWIREGKLPPPTKVGPFINRWRKSDCQRLLDEMQKAAERKAQP